MSTKDDKQDGKIAEVFEVLERGLVAGLIINQRGRRKKKRGNSMHGNILHTHMHTNSHRQVHTHMSTHIHKHTWTHMYMHTCTHKHTAKHSHITCTQKKSYAYMHELTHALTHTCIQILSQCTHTCVYTSIHMHTLLLTNTVMLKNIQKQLVVITAREQSTVG